MSAEMIDPVLSRREFLKDLPKYFWKGLQNFKPIQDVQKSEYVKKMIVLDQEKCLAWADSDCQACYLACPLRDKALSIKEGKPFFTLSFCDECGRCVSACQLVNDLVALKQMVVQEAGL